MKYFNYTLCKAVIPDVGERSSLTISCGDEAEIRLDLQRATRTYHRGGWMLLGDSSKKELKDKRIAVVVS